MQYSYFRSRLRLLFRTRKTFPSKCSSEPGCEFGSFHWLQCCNQDFHLVAKNKIWLHHPNFFGRPSIEIFCFIFQHFFQHSSPPSFFFTSGAPCTSSGSSNAKEALKTQVTEGCTFIPPQRNYLFSSLS